MASHQQLFSVLVTGANRGIGLEFVKQLATTVHHPPVHIFAGCRDSSKADRLKEIASTASGRTSVHVIELDVSNDKQILNAAEQVGSVVGDKGLNLLINNAGILEREGSSLPTVRREAVQRHFDINCTSVIMMSQAFLPLLKKAATSIGGNELSVSKAAILNISSTGGSISSTTMGSANYGFSYNASKTALNMITKMLSKDLEKDGVLCACFCPGWVQTDMGSAKAQLTPEQSVGSLLNTFFMIKSAQNGAYLNRNGQPIAY